MRNIWKTIGPWLAGVSGRASSRAHWLVVGIAVTAVVQATPLEMFLSRGPRGGRVGWARLVTQRVDWRRHARADHRLTEFMYKYTTINIDPVWYAADPRQLDQLCSYPLIFVNDVRELRNREAEGNVAEYLRRGGFLLVDACQGTETQPEKFLNEHIALFHGLLPEAEIRELPPSHPLYRSYFDLNDHPPHTWNRSNDAELSRQWTTHPFTGVFIGERLVAVFSLSSMQCAWDGYASPGGDVEAMKAIVNTYVYAMTW